MSFAWTSGQRLFPCTALHNLLFFLIRGAVCSLRGTQCVHWAVRSEPSRCRTPASHREGLGSIPAQSTCQWVRLLSEYFVFTPESLSQRYAFIFIYTLLIPGLTGIAWEPSKNQCSFRNQQEDTEIPRNFPVLKGLELQYHFITLRR
jgi:hypothetical protein